MHVEQRAVRLPEGFIIGDIEKFARAIWMSPEYIITPEGQEIVALAHENGFPVKLLKAAA